MSSSHLAVMVATAGDELRAEDFGQQFGLDLETDSSAAKGVAARRGVENMSSSHLTVMVATAGDELRAEELWAAVRSRLGDGLDGSQRCCYEKRSEEYVIFTPCCYGCNGG